MIATMIDERAPDYSLQKAVIDALAEHGDWAGYLERMIAWEEANPPRFNEDGERIDLGFDFRDVAVPPVVLNQLMFRGVLTSPFHSRSTTTFRLVSREDTQESLDMLRVVPPAPQEGEVISVESLFGLVVGHENAKSLLRYAITSEKPVHCLLVGPPGSAKTLMLGDISALPGAEFYAGSTTSRAGLVGLLLARNLRYLILDEIDKMDPSDTSPLLNLMEGGVVTELKFKREQRVVRSTRVFAAANDLRKIPAPILSRFLKVEIPAYTRAEFLVVAVEVLKREGLGPEVSKHVAFEVSRFSLDVRDAVRVGRLAKGRPQDTSLILRAMFPEGRVTELRTS